MRELGEYLKQMRESRGVSLEEVAEATKVKIQYLRALEEGRYDLLPPDIYVRGFLRSYAEYLGIDPEELYARYEADKPRKKSGLFARRETSAPAPKLTTPTEQVSAGKPATNIAKLWDTLKAIPVVVYAFAGLIILIGLILILSLGGKSEPAPETVSEAILGDTTVQRVAPAPEDEDMSQAIKISIDSINAIQALAMADSLTYVVRAKAYISRIYAEADTSKTLYRGKLRRGQVVKWRVKNYLYIECSNFPALEISVNGFDLKPLQGHIASLTLDRSNIQMYLEGYVPPPQQISSAYGQRIESPGADTMPRPPSERPVRLRRKRNTSNINLPPLAPKPVSAESESVNHSAKPKIKPPKSNQLKPPSPQEGNQ